MGSVTEDEASRRKEEEEDAFQRALDECELWADLAKGFDYGTDTFDY